MEERTAVVTGAGRGLGRAIAVALAGEGATTWICARTDSELEETAEQIRSRGGKVEPFRLDLADEKATQRFIAGAIKKSGPVDVLVNNAGILRLTPIEKLTAGEWSQTIAVNLTAPYLLTRAVLPGMKERGGSIINVSSRAGVMGFKDESAYCTSKFGLEGMTRALAVELEATNISINTVTPGLRIKPTSMTEEAFKRLPEREREVYHDPEELASAFLLLARLRGEVSGCRFDAGRLSQAVRREGYDLTPNRIRELAE
jgi:3-oxoacyl-[acyl-carrier protein] reductase